MQDMKLRTALIQPKFWLVELKDDDYNLDMDAMGEFPVKAIDYYKERREQNMLDHSTGWWQPLEDVLNDFLDENEITRDKLIDIKYQASGNADFDSHTALVIYEILG